jgi:hypothetical protein
MKISETPEKWTILKVGDFYKVFGTWAGGYIGNDRWKLNSGISKVESDDKYYYIIGYSGSCYKCKKTSYGVITSYGRNILDVILLDSNAVIVEESKLEEVFNNINNTTNV